MQAAIDKDRVYLKHNLWSRDCHICIGYVCVHWLLTIMPGVGWIALCVHMFSWKWVIRCEIKRSIATFTKTTLDWLIAPIKTPCLCTPTDTDWYVSSNSPGLIDSKALFWSLRNPLVRFTHRASRKHRTSAQPVAANRPLTSSPLTPVNRPPLSRPHHVSHSLCVCGWVGG